MKTTQYTLIVLSTLCLTTAALATGPGITYLTEKNLIDGNSFNHATGIINVNSNSGDENAQSNKEAISVNSKGPAVAVTVTIQPKIKNAYFDAPTESSAQIIGKAFSNVSGILAINQASGLANSQANSTAIAVGLSGFTVADNILAYTVSSSAVHAQASSSDKQWVDIANTAFEGTSGLVQINQTAGSMNSTANRFALRISGSATP